MQITARNIVKGYNGNTVLDGIDLDITEGKIVCIIGGSGQGKSVTLRMLTGLDRPESGSILIDGNEIANQSERNLLPIRRRMGVVFQGGALLKSLTVEENVGLFLSEQHIASKKDIRVLVEECLESVDMESKIDAMPSDLSGGMIKRVAIARALTMRPEIIFYDEPTAGLDPPMKSQVDELIDKVNKKYGVTSVVVTHDMQSVFRMADSIYMLRSGKFIFNGSRDDLAKSDNEDVGHFLDRDHTTVEKFKLENTNRP